MYNRYIPNGTSYTRVVEQDDQPPKETSSRPVSAPESPRPPRPEAAPQAVRQAASFPKGSPSSLLSGFAASRKNAGIAGILEKFKLTDADTGDILLILILLFLFRDGDDMELVITLGLILLLGLGDSQQDTGKNQEA